MKPIVGRKVWFGPRRFGWGLEPVSVEGWLVGVSAVLLSVAARRTDRYRAPARWMVGLLVVVTLLKGTTPGGSDARRKLLDARENARTRP